MKRKLKEGTLLESDVVEEEEEEKLMAFFLFLKNP